MVNLRKTLFIKKGYSTHGQKLRGSLEPVMEKWHLHTPSFNCQTFTYIGLDVTQMKVGIYLYCLRFMRRDISKYLS